MNTNEMISFITFLLANNGLTMDEIVDATGKERTQIDDLLIQINNVGVPPYTPSDHVTVDVRSDDRVFLEFAHQFKRPLQLSANETMALKFAVEHAKRSADDLATSQYDDAMKAIQNLLHGKAKSTLESKGRRFVLPERTKVLRKLAKQLESAIDDGQRIEIEYFSAWRGELKHRVVHPYALVEFGAHFYLFAFCESAGATRHFRVTRIKSVRNLRERHNTKPPSNPKYGQMQSLFEGKAPDSMVLEFKGDAVEHAEARFTQMHGVKMHQEKNRLRVTIPVYNRNWAIGLAMEYLGRATVVDSKKLRDDLESTVAKLLEAHS